MIERERVSTALFTPSFSKPQPSDVDKFLRVVHNRARQFDGWTSAELRMLGSIMPLSPFSQNDVLMRQGERGSWFGIVLSGTLVVESVSKAQIAIEASDIVGEMALWQGSRIRSANVQAKEGGYIATMSFESLQDLLSRNDAIVVLKLMRIVCGKMCQRGMDNLHRERALVACPTLAWPAESVRSVEHSTYRTLESDKFELHESFRKRCAMLLDSQLRAVTRETLSTMPPDAQKTEIQFNAVELTNIFDVAQFQPFAAEDVLVAEGQKVDRLMILLRGAAVIERWGIELGEGAVLGLLDYYDHTFLTMTSPITACVDGVVASISFANMTKLLAMDGDLVHKLLTALGGYTMRLMMTATEAIKDRAHATQMIDSCADSTPLRVKVGKSARPAQAAAASEGFETAENFYLKKMQEQSARLTHALDEVERLQATVQETQQGALRYRFLHASSALRVENREEEVRQLKWQISELSSQVSNLTATVERERKAKTDWIEVATQLSAAALAALSCPSPDVQAGSFIREGTPRHKDLQKWILTVDNRRREAALDTQLSEHRTAALPIRSAAVDHVHDPGAGYLRAKLERHSRDGYERPGSVSCMSNTNDTGIGGSANGVPSCPNHNGTNGAQLDNGASQLSQMMPRSAAMGIVVSAQNVDANEASCAVVMHRA